VDIGDYPCIEVDFPEDLQRAKRFFGLWDATEGKDGTADGAAGRG
jgi:choline kinase